jgi:hypothetical protein
MASIIASFWLADRHTESKLEAESATNVTAWQLSVIEALTQLAGLPENPPEWQARRPSTSALKMALDVVRLVHRVDVPQPMVVPRRDRGLQFEWRGGRRELEIGFLNTGALEYVQSENDQDISEGFTGISRIPEFIDWMMNG